MLDLIGIILDGISALLDATFMGRWGRSALLRLGVKVPDTEAAKAVIGICLFVVLVLVFLGVAFLIFISTRRSG